eukprot:250504-Prymnesium_polylepis.1
MAKTEALVEWKKKGKPAKEGAQSKPAPSKTPVKDKDFEEDDDDDDDDSDSEADGGEWKPKPKAKPASEAPKKATPKAVAKGKSPVTAAGGPK